MSSLFVKNASAIVTCDEQDTVLENAGILIRDGAVAYIGAESQEADEVLDASGCIVYPGLINTHHHLYQTFSRNLPQVHTIMRMIRLVTECVCPGVILKGEVVMAPRELAPYFGTPEKPECHLLYNASTMATQWSALVSGDVRQLKRQLDDLHSLPAHCCFVNYLRCHDDIGWGLDYPWLGSCFGQQEVPHKKYLNDYFTGKWPGSPSRGELYNDDPRLGDARLCGTTASLCGIEAALEAGDPALLEQALAREAEALCARRNAPPPWRDQLEKALLRLLLIISYSPVFR